MFSTGISVLTSDNVFIEAYKEVETAELVPPSEDKSSIPPGNRKLIKNADAEDRRRQKSDDCGYNIAACFCKC